MCSNGTFVTKLQLIFLLQLATYEIDAYASPMSEKQLKKASKKSVADFFKALTGHPFKPEDLTSTVHDKMDGAIAATKFAKQVRRRLSHNICHTQYDSGQATLGVIFTYLGNSPSLNQSLAAII